MLQSKHLHTFLVLMFIALGYHACDILLEAKQRSQKQTCMKAKGTAKTVTHQVPNRL